MIGCEDDLQRRPDEKSGFLFCLIEAETRFLILLKRGIPLSSVVKERYALHLLDFFTIARYFGYPKDANTTSRVDTFGPKGTDECALTLVNRISPSSPCLLEGMMWKTRPPAWIPKGVHAKNVDLCVLPFLASGRTIENKTLRMDHVWFLPTSL